MTLIQARRRMGMLPREAYVGAEMYAADLETIWYREWLFVGHTVEIAADGQFFTVQIGDYPVLVVRDEQGGINAFVNRCRHRGSRLCSQAQGDVGRFVCPYHGWTYGLDGQLLHAAHMGEGFTREDKGLQRVHCHVSGIYIFVCLAPTPAKSLQAFESELGRFLAPYALADAKVIHQTTTVEDGNWKLVWENNRECYHCDANHPELMNSFQETLSVAAVDDPANEEERRFGERCEAAGFPSRLSVSDDGQHRIVRIPLSGQAVSQTLDGRLAVTNHLLTDTRGLNTGNLLYFHYPNTWNHVMPDYMITFRVLPIAADKTEVTTKWLLHGQAQEGRDYQLRDVIAVWEATNAQDARLVGECHAGIRAPGFDAGSFSPLVEHGPAQWVDWYCRRFAENWARRVG